MDTITPDVMQEAGERLRELPSNLTVCTVTVELNGQHGGADVIVTGLLEDDGGLMDTEARFVVR